MIPLDHLLALPALALSVTVGLLAHEWSHALALRLAGIEYSVDVFPDRSDGPLAALASCPWALVEPRPTGREPAWPLRVAALTPLTLALPVFALAATGYVPSLDDPVTAAVALGWLACAVPSPQDFSVAFYAHRVLDATGAAGADPNGEAARAD